MSDEALTLEDYIRALWPKRRLMDIEAVEVFHQLRHDGYRVVKLSPIDGPVDADIAAWDGDGFRVTEELR